MRHHWSKETHLDDDGYIPQSVLRGRRFESVTVGKMPNRQVITYDKRRAAIDLKQPYWFDVWGVDRSDPSQQVWRVEIRAGRDALAKKLPRRHFDATEAYAREFLTTAAGEIRYLAEPPTRSNVSRELDHPLWSIVRDRLKTLPAPDLPALPEGRALELLREQRLEMAQKQAFGNLINALVLEGHDRQAIVSGFSDQATKAARHYAEGIGRQAFIEKVGKASDRLGCLFPRAE